MFTNETEEPVGGGHWDNEAGEKDQSGLGLCVLSANSQAVS